MLPVEGDRLPLVHGGVDGDETTYEVRDPHGGQVRTSTGSPYRASTAYWLSAVEDRNGNRVVFSRRPDGAPTAVSHTGGYVVQITATTSRVTDLAVRGPGGPATVVGYGYDPTGHLIALTGPDGPSGPAMAFTYDGDGRVTSWTDRNGFTFQYVYDGQGRVARTIRPGGTLSSSFAYGVHPETGHPVTRYTDSTGAITVLHLNDRLQVVAETDPLGHTTHLTWDAYDRPLTRTDALGHTTELTWSEDGDLIAVRLPDGSTSTARYDERHLPVEITGDDDTVWRQTFDDLGNCTSVQAPDGTARSFTHDRTGAIATMTDAVGSTIRIRSDRAGLALEVGDDERGVTRVERDHRGRPLRIVDPAGGVQEFVRDGDDHLLARTVADGSRETWTWEAEGNCAAYTDAAGGVWGTEYGPFDKPLVRSDPDGARHQLRYDTELRLVEVTNPLGQHWTYTYDAAGNLTAETDFEGRTSHYAYDPANRIIRRTNPAGQTVDYTWDAMGRLTSDEADDDLTHYSYDLTGALVEARTATSTLSVERDAMGRPLSETVDGRTLRYAYDPSGRRIARTTPTGAVTSLAYDPAGHRSHLAVDGHTLTFGHDLLGREITRVWGDPGTPVTLSTTWDSVSRPTAQSLVAGTGPTPVVTRDYAYRADGFPLVIGEQNPGGERDAKQIILDPMGRPLAVTGTGWQENYGYDRVGNQATAHWPARAGHGEARGPRTYAGTRLLMAGSLHYEYDAAGRVVVRRLSRLLLVHELDFVPERRLLTSPPPGRV
ncbi:hypothetical protein ACFY8F_16160 [Streptomyces tanashiensis]|uniref:hypothetical protein n=1 Tax=Streptomyces tanashiensis TaxID=67367 RepID=UPI00367BA54E